MTDWISKYGLPIVVCSCGIITLVMMIRQIWIPRLKARSELETLKDRSEYEREARIADMEIRHKEEVHEAHIAERKASVELTEATRDAVKTIKETQQLLVDPMNVIIDGNTELLAAHNDWRVGQQFESITLKKAAIVGIQELAKRNQVDQSKADEIVAFLNEGLPENERLT